MPIAFEFTSPLSAEECAQRLAGALHEGGAIHPSALPRAMFDQRLWGKVENGRFEVEIQFGFRQLGRRLSGTLHAEAGGTRVAGECSGGAERHLLIFMRIFLFLFAAFPTVLFGLIIGFGKLERPLEATLLLPVWPGLVYAFWRFGRKSMAETAEAPITYLKGLLS